MANLVPSKWFANKSLKLSLPRRSGKPSDVPSPSVASPTVRDNGRAHKFHEAFRYFDRDGDGKISSEELIALFASLGDHISSDEAIGIISEHDTDGDNLMDLQDFMRLMERDHGEDELKKAFEMFEVDKGSGCITPKGLQRMFNRLGDNRSDEECEAMIRVFDLDGNGVVDFHEFHRMMT
ncbi:probable calcium-binding protein CML41 [Magnolia sinica]|uniref:probable calcium-binding protein CML41 n=1 Tax=Magnolia sinica TaxID=86752 RepID=UPI002657F1A9|nr:probable calcium-binding protein CML41 [Magnolia sinica]